ncbi:MAG: glycoside hydrolase family 2 protein [Conexibacter sp.]|nr:glycoside hydrolase family 2 protein [Conexibacter sp.]
MGGHERRALETGWEATSCPPDAHVDPADLDGLDWLAARVPGTAAAALHDAGRWRPGEPSDLDAEDWWFRTRFAAPAATPGEEVVLALDGIATVADVFLNGTRVLESVSMFAAHEVGVGALLAGENELAIRCRALAPLLRTPRKPRARWRTRLVADGSLRWFRTALLGRAPGFAPGPAAVGPWRPVRLERRRRLALDALTLDAGLDRDDGLLTVEATLRTLPGGEQGGSITSAEVALAGPSGAHRCGLLATARGPGTVTFSGELRVPRVARWWPHTHGTPVLHDVVLEVAADDGTVVSVDAGRVGFRSLAAGPRADHDVEHDGLDLHVNGVRVFARGAVWTPVDPIGLAPPEPSLRAALEQARDAGMNLLRVPGTSAYESPAFFDLCDELGLLVWQDFMFANLDYPVADAGFRATVEDEARDLLAALAGRPCVAVFCGNSEIEQQVAMLGLDPALGRGELFGELLPRAVSRAATDAVYVPSAPCGGELPFRPGAGVANYYGVGGYRRPLEDARRADVRFASECLAFANVPDEEGVEALMPELPANVVVHHPRWKAGVPRDAGSGWDFDDVRDHYLALLFGVDPGELRRVDHARYLDLSRAVTGEAMAEVFGEWRRSGSPCGGGIVLWLRDLAPGAGWGVVDAAGTPKVAYHHLRRALAPVAVWTTDEGLGGIDVHVANDRPERLVARLRVALYRDGEHRVDAAAETIELDAHSATRRSVEGLLGRFVDAAWAYRFGPPAHDVVVASLERDGAGGTELLSQAFRFPAGRPLRQEPADRLGLENDGRRAPDGSLLLELRATRVVYGLRIHVPGYLPGDDALTLEPGATRTVALRPAGDELPPPAGTLTALNLQGRQRIAIQEDASDALDRELRGFAPQALAPSSPESETMPR